MFPQNALIPWLIGSQLSLVFFVFQSSYIIQNYSKANYIYRGARVVQWWEYTPGLTHCQSSLSSPPAFAAHVTRRWLGTSQFSSYDCLGSNPGVNTTCGLSLLLALSFQISIQPEKQLDEEPLFWMCYL